MADSETKYIENLILELNSEFDSKTKKALIALTKLTKNKENARLFCLKGGLKQLLALIQRPNTTVVDMALSTLANCVLDEQCRKEVRRLDGIATLAGVLTTAEKMSILNRTSRALANLAEDELSVLVMEELGVIPALLKLLIKTSDSDCQVSVLRAVRMVCTTAKRKQAVLDLDAMKTIVDLLKSDKPSVVNCCIRTLAELTKGCSKEIAQQVQEYGGVKIIVDLSNSDNGQVRHSALLMLANLAFHSQVRVCIGSEGGIKALTEQLKREEPGHVTAKVIEGICFCCREAINRRRVCESGALELLLKILSSGKMTLSLEKKIVNAFTWFYYCEPALETLISADLVPILLRHLNRVLSHLPWKNELEDHHDDFSEQLSFTSDISSDSPRAASIKETFFDASAENMDEGFLKRLEETAREIHISDSKASGRLSNFKRRMKLKASPIPTTPPPGLCTVGSGKSVFSFASRQTDTTSLVSVCTSSCSISSLASSGNSTNLLMSSYPSVLSSSQIMSPSQNKSFSSNNTGEQSKDPFIVQIEKENTSIESKYSLMTPGKNAVTKTPNFMTNGSFAQPPSPRTQGGSHHHRSPGYSTLLLLFRISHMADPSSLLVNRPCIQALLRYLHVVENPGPKCARVLSSLVSNPLCFKALVVNGAVVAFHHELCCMYYENQETAAAVTENTAANQDTRVSDHVLCDSHSSCTNLLDLRHECSTPEQHKASEPDDCQSYHCASSATQSYCQETGKQLLEVCSSQAETPFGKGVLENLLLKRSNEECKECVLALPLLCRTKKLKQQMLVERKGLLKFCDLLMSAHANSETFTTAIEALIVLANDLHVTFPVDTEASLSRRSSESSVCKDSAKPHGSVHSDGNVGKLHEVKYMTKDTSCLVKQKCAADFHDSMSCFYEEKCLVSCDLNFQMDDGTIISAHKQVMEMASNYFTAMLSYRYLESTQAVIQISDVSPNVFEFALHHIYGCTIASSKQPAEASSSVLHCQVLKRNVSQLQTANTRLELFLQLLAFSDRFMLDSLRTVCEQFLIDLIDTSSVVQICNLGLRLNSPQLCTHCLCYLLQVKISDLPSRMHLFKELFLCSDKKDIVQQLYQLLLQHLNNIKP